MLTWKSLIATLTKRGFKGDETATLESVTQFVNEKNLNLVDSDGDAVDLGAVRKSHFAEKLTIESDEDAEVAARQKAHEAESAKRKAAAGRAAETLSATNPGDDEGKPQRFSIANSEIKSYNARAKRGLTSFQSAEDSQRFGAWVKSTFFPRAASRDDVDLVRKTMTTNINTAGGALVPDEFIPQLIDLKELRGEFRKIVGVTKTSTGQVNFPRRTGGQTVYFPGEAGSITASDVAVNNVGVTAVKMATRTAVGAELLNDSAINVGDMVAREIAYAFADKEDEIGFNGDATSTYGGMTGFRAAFTNLSGTIANIAGLTVGSGNLYSELALTDFEDVFGNLPQYAANDPSACWVMHRRMWAGTSLRLALAQGGSTSNEVYMDGGTLFLFGKPVKFVQVMPRIAGNSQVCALLGAFNQAAKAIEVRGMEIAVSEHVGFATDTIEFRGIQRFGVTVHDVGNASATAASRVAGPVVGLITAAS